MSERQSLENLDYPPVTQKASEAGSTPGPVTSGGSGTAEPGRLTASEAQALSAKRFREEHLDPAPHPIDVARQRAADLVRNIADNTKLALRRRRDEIDNTIARIEKSEAALSHFIGEFAQFNHEGLELAAEVEKLIENIATPFKADPPATLTQLKNGT